MPQLYIKQLPSVTNINKNLAIANRSRVTCAHNTSSAVHLQA